MPKQLRERSRLVEVDGGQQASPTRRRIQIITPGWGSSGYYSADVLERAAQNKVIPAGTHMYLNHASESEHRDRPERDVEKIAAVLVEDAVWDGTRLAGDADLIGPHAELIEALAPYIGVSISGSATDITIGEAEGRTGPIIEDLAHVDSVDFVTHAGRGGMVLLESARPSMVNAAAVRHGVAEATANETREQLQQALRDLLGGDQSWVWVRDFDDTTVWFEHETPDSSGTYSLAYETADSGEVSLAGSPVEVRATTTYVPVRPGGTTPTEESHKENPMPEIKIDEAEHTRLVAEAGRVATLESERDAAVSERDQARHDLATERATGRARTLIDESEHVFTPLEADALLVNLPLAEADGIQVLDETAFGERLTESAKRSGAAQTTTTGGVRGFGASHQPGDSVAESGRPSRSAWGRPLTESSTEQKGA